MTQRVGLVGRACIGPRVVLERVRDLGIDVVRTSDSQVCETHAPRRLLSSEGSACNSGH